MQKTMVDIKSRPPSPEIAGIRNAINFINMRPGGNNTSLCIGINENPAERKRINDELMALYPGSIEQVGFVDLTPGSYRLQMAFNEFCGNATRSAAYVALDGQQGEIEIVVSDGTKDGVRLKAGVAEDGEAFAQMPIYAEPDRVEEDLALPGNSTVRMKGITHYVNWDTNIIKDKTDEEIKAIGLQIIKERQLISKSSPAAGVIFAERTENGIKITPVVRVGEIDSEDGTTFLETACGSGTMAVAMSEAKKTGVSIKDLSIIQPSGMPIRATVNYTGTEFTYAEIKGPLDFLNTGTLVETGSGPCVVEQISSKEMIMAALNEGGLKSLYRDSFNVPPYEEDFPDDEIEGAFLQYMGKGTLFLARSQEKVVGFGAALPLPEDAKVAEIASRFGFDMETTQYMADLGVDEDWRKNDIAKILALSRISTFPKGTTVLMRTSENNIYSKGLYAGLGFKEVPNMIQKVERKRIGGKTSVDTRIFMSKVI